MTAGDRAFLKELLDTPSPTGFELPGQRVWARRVREFASEVGNDAYGNTWATLNGRGGPTLMLEAHADEIGFMVKYITDDGFLHVDRIGGSDHAIARGKRIRILGDDGPVLGVIGNTAIHLRERGTEEKAPKLEELFVDIGAGSPDEVAQRGIRVGHPAVYTDSVDELGDGKLIGRALDNRLGGFVIAKVLENLAASADPPVATVLAVNAVQEEIGGNGARMVSYRLEPQIALVLDVTHATDSPGIKKEKHGKVVLGEGPSITHGTVNHPLIVERLMKLAEAESIPLQHEASSRFSGTDTDKIFVTKRGIPSALISIPMRYMHSTIEMVDLRDVERTVALMTAFARSIGPDESFRSSLA
ncbi:MAG: M42 family metallopeptidase [Rhodothermales bacterium]|nr:M42 family metallopeptidase [Rhodothermales bacterium]MBO6778325.1 M42 family metallopeptidase [Rhodothermales bacterium]